MLECDVKVWFGPVDVDEGGEDDGHGDLRTLDDGGNKGGEGGVLEVMREGG